MEVIPALDLAGGGVVRLLQGRFESETRFSDDPVQLATAFASAGARWLHVVDLDAARTGERSDEHARLLERLVARPGLEVQMGGGLRSEEDVDAAIALGAARVLLGTMPVRDPETYHRLVERHGVRICLTADTLSGSVRVAGWVEDSGRDVVDLVRREDAAGTRCFLVTAIERDGTLAGPDLALYRRLREATGGTLIASGGVATAEHVRALAVVRCDAVVIGRALLDGSLDYGEARKAAG